MSPLPRMPIPFGSGLDREAGIMVAEPARLLDARNVLFRRGRALARPGFLEAVEILDDTGSLVSHVIAGHELRSDRVGLVVSYQSTTQKVWIHRIDVDATTAQRIGEWVNDREVQTGETTAWGSTPPRVERTEVYSRVFFAHDERLVSRRAPTIYYDFNSGTLKTLTGNFLAAGTHDLRFRGVVRHLSYLAGWGYGDESEDRPDIVRVSAPDDPIAFNPNHYFIAGSPRDAVLCCRPAGGSLLVFKQGETHAIVGSGRDDFGILLVDELHGVLGTQLAASFGGRCLGWSLEGPRLWTGAGPSQELATLLELGGFDPESLVPEGDESEAFAHYRPDLRQVAFVFGQRAYVLDVRVDGQWKWSYDELTFSVKPLCAFILSLGGTVEPPAPPEGQPKFQAAEAGGSFADLVITNHDHDGDETLEVWFRVNPAGAWSNPLNPPVSSAVNGSEQTPKPRLTGLTIGTTYDVSLRHRRGTAFHPLYDDPDPATWPVVSQGQFTPQSDPPTLDSLTWDRTAAGIEKVGVQFTPSNAVDDVEIQRDGVPAGTVAAATHLGAQFTFDDEVDAVDNQVTAPDDFTNLAWNAATGVTVTADAATDPDGGTGMDLVKEGTAVQVHSLHEDFTKPAAAEDWVVAIVTAKEARPGVRLEISDAAGNGVRIDQADIALAVAVHEVFGTGFTFKHRGRWSIDEDRHGFYLVVETNSATTVRLLLAPHDGVSANYDGDGSSGIYMWRAWAQQASFPPLRGETFASYQMRTLTSPPSALSAAQNLWVGPPPIPSIPWGVGDSQAYQVGLDDLDPALGGEVWDDWDDAAGANGADRKRGTFGASATAFQSPVLGNIPTDAEGNPEEITVRVKIRQEATEFGIDDFGRFSAARSVVIPGGGQV